jgi:hypothetical protein
VTEIEFFKDFVAVKEFLDHFEFREVGSKRVFG